MTVGVVKCFNEPAGFGFIKPAAGGFDVFVQEEDVKRADLSADDVAKGSLLEFDVAADSHGFPHAINLRIPRQG